MIIEYFLVLFVAFIFPFILSFSKEINFYKKPLRLVLSIGIPGLIFIIWDVIATERGHWYFNKNYIVGVKIYNLPLEEILFFIVIPFCALFSWESVKYFFNKYKSKK